MIKLAEKEYIKWPMGILIMANGKTGREMDGVFKRSQMERSMRVNG